MSRFWWAWISAIPLALGGLWLPIRFGVTQVDSPTIELFGGPLPWRQASLVSSMETQVFLGPLVIDAAFWLLLALGVIHFWRRHVPDARVLNTGAAVVSAAVGAMAIMSTASMRSWGVTTDLWYSPFAMTFVSLGLVWP
jgi:hypothetical protein